MRAVNIFNTCALVKIILLARTIFGIYYNAHAIDIFYCLKFEYCHIFLNKHKHEWTFYIKKFNILRNDREYYRVYLYTWFIGRYIIVNINVNRFYYTTITSIILFVIIFWNFVIKLRVILFYVEEWYYGAGVEKCFNIRYASEVILWGSVKYMYVGNTSKM